jgi:hypothetical protein
VVTSTPGTAGPLLAGACLQSIGVVSTWLILTFLCVLATAFLAISVLRAQWRTVSPLARKAADPHTVPSQKGRAA